ncbi:hypothetical protein LY76DRAFT_599573 [Colletotrichum caudatum]|nr:hypothetical protein LY76DRAFT_599573 [Colletotrichum caudatum]
MLWTTTRIDKSQLPEFFPRNSRLAAPTRALHFWCTFTGLHAAASSARLTLFRSLL